MAGYWENENTYRFTDNKSEPHKTIDELRSEYHRFMENYDKSLKNKPKETAKKTKVLIDKEAENINKLTHFIQTYIKDSANSSKEYDRLIKFADQQAIIHRKNTSEDIAKMFVAQSKTRMQWKRVMDALDSGTLESNKKYLEMVKIVEQNNQKIINEIKQNSSFVKISKKIADDIRTKETDINKRLSDLVVDMTKQQKVYAKGQKDFLKKREKYDEIQQKINQSLVSNPKLKNEYELTYEDELLNTAKERLDLKKRQRELGGFKTSTKRLIKSIAGRGISAIGSNAIGRFFGLDIKGEEMSQEAAQENLEYEKANQQFENINKEYSKKKKISERDNRINELREVDQAVADSFKSEMEAAQAQSDRAKLLIQDMLAQKLTFNKTIQDYNAKNKELKSKGVSAIGEREALINKVSDQLNEKNIHTTDTYKSSYDDVKNRDIVEEDRQEKEDTRNEGILTATQQQAEDSRKTVELLDKLVKKPSIVSVSEDTKHGKTWMDSIGAKLGIPGLASGIGRLIFALGPFAGYTAAIAGTAAGGFALGYAINRGINKLLGENKDGSDSFDFGAEQRQKRVEALRNENTEALNRDLEKTSNKWVKQSQTRKAMALDKLDIDYNSAWGKELMALPEDKFKERLRKDFAKTAYTDKLVTDIINQMEAQERRSYKVREQAKINRIVSQIDMPGPSGTVQSASDTLITDNVNVTTESKGFSDIEKNEIANRALQLQDKTNELLKELNETTKNKDLTVNTHIVKSKEPGINVPLTPAYSY